MNEEIKNEETTNSLNEVLNETAGQLENNQDDPNLVTDVDDMRSSFYNTALNMFEAAKHLKKYDIFYTDTLLAQAQYFLNLADNYDTLYTLARMSKEMPLNKLSSNIPSTVVDQIDDYAAAIKDRLETLKNKADVSEDISNDVDKIAESIKQKLGNVAE